MEISDRQWHEGSDKAISIFLNGEELLSPNSYGERIVDDSFLLFFNANPETMEFTIPLTFKEYKWKVIFDTKNPIGFIEDGKTYHKESLVPIAARSLVMLSCPICFDTL